MCVKCKFSINDCCALQPDTMKLEADEFVVCLGSNREKIDCPFWNR